MARALDRRRLGLLLPRHAGGRGLGGAPVSLGGFLCHAREFVLGALAFLRPLLQCGLGAFKRMRVLASGRQARGLVLPKGGLLAFALGR